MTRSEKTRSKRMYSALASRLSSRSRLIGDGREISFPGVLHAFAPSLLQRLELLRTAVSFWFSQTLVAGKGVNSGVSVPHTVLFFPDPC